MICSTCGTNIMARVNFVKFECPECAKTEIVRCQMCKDLGNKYKCNECEFVGP